MKTRGSWNWLVKDMDMLLVMKKSINFLVLMVMVLETMGDLSSWLDTISPEQYVDIVDRPEGGYVVVWVDNEPSDKDNKL